MVRGGVGWRLLDVVVGHPPPYTRPPFFLPDRVRLGVPKNRADGQLRVVKLGSPRRLKTIFRTNPRVSAAARWQRIQDHKGPLQVVGTLSVFSGERTGHRAVAEGLQDRLHPTQHAATFPPLSATKTGPTGPRVARICATKTRPNRAKNTVASEAHFAGAKTNVCLSPFR